MPSAVPTYQATQGQAISLPLEETHPEQVLVPAALVAIGLCTLYAIGRNIQSDVKKWDNTYGPHKPTSPKKKK